VATLLTRSRADSGQVAVAPYMQRAVGARLGLCNGAQGEGGAVGRVHQMSRQNGGVMNAVTTNVGVFFGHVGKRAEGWYWAGAQSENLRGAIRGRREAPSDEPQERGAA
jgi:hypothetical protein